MASVYSFSLEACWKVKRNIKCSNSAFVKFLDNKDLEKSFPILIGRLNGPGKTHRCRRCQQKCIFTHHKVSVCLLLADIFHTIKEHISNWRVVRYRPQSERLGGSTSSVVPFVPQLINNSKQHTTTNSNYFFTGLITQLLLLCETTGKNKLCITFA